LPRKKTKKRVTQAKKVRKGRPSPPPRKKSTPRAQPRVPVKRHAPRAPKSAPRAPKWTPPKAKARSVGKPRWAPSKAKAPPKPKWAPPKAKKSVVAKPKWQPPKLPKGLTKGQRAAIRRWEKEEAARKKRAARTKARHKQSERAWQTAQEVKEEQAKRSRKRSRRAKRGVKTRTTRELRRDLFEGATHAELLRHLQNASSDWVFFKEQAGRGAGWDTRRIRDEFFSPKVKGKR